MILQHLTHDKNYQVFNFLVWEKKNPIYWHEFKTCSIIRLQEVLFFFLVSVNDCILSFTLDYFVGCWSSSTVLTCLFDNQRLMLTFFLFTSSFETYHSNNAALVSTVTMFLLFVKGWMKSTWVSYSLFLFVSGGLACPLLPLPSSSRYKLSSMDIPDMVSYPMPQVSSSYSGHASSSVAMVSGLHLSKMNCARIFNLFCLYGNIEKVGGLIFMRCFSVWNTQIVTLCYGLNSQKILL